MADEYELKKSSRETSRNIPDEVLFEEILVRLPVKPLIAYKSVCKTWLSTIESRSFIEAHRRHHCCDYSDQIVFTPFESVSDSVTKSSSLLPSIKSFRSSLIKMTYRPLDEMLPPEVTRINWSDVQLYPINVTHMDWTVGIRVLGPIRNTSIYCVVSYRQLRATFKCQDILGAKIAICNPSTRDYKLASPFPPMEMHRLLKLAATRYCCANYGFGVAADGDYKVVAVVTCPHRESIVSYVYSLRQGTWKKIVDSNTRTRMVSRLNLRNKQGYPYIHDNRLELCSQVFLNGCWHWNATFKDYTSHVLTFNVDSETFNLVWGPPSCRERMPMVGGIRTSSIVSVLNGHLALLTNGIGGISVWMMMEYGDEESWINVWRVNLESCHISRLVGITYSLRVDSNGGIQIERVLFEDNFRKLVCCDAFGAVKIQQHGRFDTFSCIFWNTFGISAYSETLERLPPSKHDSVVARLNRLHRRCKLKNQIGP